jgi:hypothetical protein
MPYPIPQQQSTSQICGPFLPEPDHPDQGQQTPLPTKFDCAAPAPVAITCNDTSYTTAYDAVNGRFIVTSRLFDSACDPILDSFGAFILTTSG